MGKKYRNPPVVEALCQFQFIPTRTWDMTIPGLMYEKTKSKFPHRQQRIGIGLQFRQTETGVEHKIEPAPPRVQFYAKDRTSLIQIGPDLLAVNQLRPYPTWARFKPKILYSLQMYQKVANPKGFKLIGLRYINKIKIPAKTIEMSDYFKIYPAIPDNLPQTHSTFISRVEIPYMDERDRMLLTLASEPSEAKDTLLLVLDIDYIMLKPEAVRINASAKWIEQAHSAIETAFESSITDKTRALFDKVK